MPELAPATPPVAKQVPHTRTIHGDAVDDPWSWLRERDDPDVVAYLEAENAHTEAVLAPTRDLQERLFQEIKGRWQETDLSVPARKGDWWYYQRTVEGLQYPIHCRSRSEAGDDGTEQALLDENAQAEGHTYFETSGLHVSPDHRLLAWGEDTSGAEVYRTRFRDLDTGADLPDELPRTYYGGAWAADSRTYLYVVPDEAMRPWQVWRHEVGSDPSADVLVYQEDDERFEVGLGATRSEAFVVIHAGSRITDEVHVLDARDPTGAPRVVAPRRDGVEYHLDHQGDRFLVVTNDGAVDFRLVEAPVASPGPEHWTELLPPRDDVALVTVEAFADHVVVHERTGALPRITVLRVSDGVQRQLAFDEEVYEVGPGANPEYHTSTYRFTYTSMVTPPSVYDEDLDAATRVLKKRHPVLGGYDQDAYVTSREWATAPDGTRVPLSIVRRRDTPVDGTAPCVLYGYGSYEASMPAAFSPARLSLLDRGVVFAIGHVRGGGELGRRWYEQGKMEAKTSTFTDFIACAEHLVATGYAAAGRLAIRGGSAGGLLVGAATAMRPDLFAAVVAEVPFVDVVNTMLDASLPLTVGEWEEWGKPEEPAAYARMKGYAPYENVASVAYPAMLVTAGLNDPRVQYWEPAKWVAKMRAVTTGDRPVLLRTELGAGHGGPSGRYDAWRDEAIVLAFLLAALGVDR
ncbi:MAG: S9 family peptidase [Acidimicrobiales bacterium]|nr:S9 family peptidase [Acidimicrobiales bacterium]